MYIFDLDGNAYTIDLSTAVATPVGCTFPRTCFGEPLGYTELAYIPGSDGQFVAQLCYGAFAADVIDIPNCSVVSDSIPNNHAFTGHAYVGNTLYGAGIDGPGTPLHYIP